jgi:hypothetical protein
MAGGLTLLSAPWQASAQEAPGAGGRLRAFLLCEWSSCDPESYRSQVPWVSWVDNQPEADVLVTLTSEADPSGGNEYGLDFTSYLELDLGDDQLFFRSSSTDTERDRIDGVATVLSIGLARYASMAGYREFVALRSPQAPGIDPDERIVAPQEVDDPWNLWVFNVGGSTRLTGTETRKTRRFSGNFSANRTTPTWKLSFSGRGNVNIQEIERSNGSIFKSDERDWTVNLGVTYALAKHWSLDLSSLTARLPRYNQKFRADLTPGIEYSLFPYEEATRRSITLRYTVAVTHRKYEERTIYNQVEETPWEEALQLRATMRQPWGDGSLTGTASHVLGDLDKHNFSLRGRVSFRLVRGLRFNVGGDVAWVTDQVYLSARGVTDEEALLRLRTRGSDFNTGLNFGFSYQFGSIYNNTVNNRFPRIGGGGGNVGGGF